MRLRYLSALRKSHYLRPTTYSSSCRPYSMRLADIAVNLTDPQFEGSYHGRQKHASDLELVVTRAKEKGVERILITGTSLSESRNALDMAKRFDLHCTAGVHPTSTSEMDKHQGGAEAYLTELRQLIEEDRGEGGSRRIISIGEIGLDYDREHFSPRETQLKHLPALLELAKRYELPMFLHSRASQAHTGLLKALRDAGWGADGQGWKGGVVHSFTGTKEEVHELVEAGLYIGVNGCSLKTSENLEAVKAIPIDRLLLETDAPWCSITSSHASHAHLPGGESPLLLAKVNKPEKWKEGSGVKGRMEPAEVGVIAHMVAQVRGESVEALSAQVWENGVKLYGW